MTQILVPVDDSDISLRTVNAIIDRKNQFPAALILLHVVEIDRLAYRMIPDFQVSMVREQARKAGEQLLQRYRQKLADAGLVADSRLEFGSPRSLICRIAEEGDFQLVVLGRRGAGEIRDVLFGSVTNHVLHRVRQPVLLF